MLTMKNPRRSVSNSQFRNKTVTFYNQLQSENIFHFFFIFIFRITMQKAEGNRLPL